MSSAQVISTSKTAQLAPAVALTLVAAGIPVILHGGENVPTKSGITPGQVLRELGIKVDLDPQSVEKMIEGVGFGFLDIAQYFPKWGDFLEIRHQFGLRTVANTIEKLFNPADAPFQISGFFHANYMERIRSTQTGTQASWMIQGEEGSIEMASGRRTKIVGTTPESDLTLSPQTVGLAERARIEIPANLIRHSKMNHSVIAGKSGPAHDQVALTAGTILHLVGCEASVSAGFITAQKLLLNKTVESYFEKIRSF